MSTNAGEPGRAGPLASIGAQRLLDYAFMIHPSHTGVLRWTLATLLAGPLAAQSLPAPVYSIGQPPIWRHGIAMLGTVFSRGDASPATGSYGVFRAITRPPSNAFNPVLGVVGVTIEGFGSVGFETEAGIRGMVTSQILATSIGADWDVRNGEVDMILSWQSAVRRGGLLGRGSMLRVDWVPNRDGLARVGVAAPLFQPLAGRTRSGRTSATLPRETPPTAHEARAPLSPAARQYAQSIEASARVVAAYSDLYRDHDVQMSRVSGYRDAMSRLHSALDGLFRSVGLDSAGATNAARRARHAVLDRVLIPVDSVFGRVKHVDVQRLGQRATGDFARWVRDSSHLAGDAADGARAAFDAWLAAVSVPVREIVGRERDSRLIWLPLDLALNLEEYDEQAEVDSLIGRVIGRPFTNRNALGYLNSTDLPLEIARSIYSARDYHVLWTHEFMGRDWYTREIDDVGYEMVADAYLPALTAAVKRYDSTGVIPTYMVHHDQYYYEVSDCRLWLSILADPLHASMRLKGDDGRRERHLRERQAELRAAVDASARLRQDALASGNAEQWLRNTIRVHVNVGNPSDFSFRSHHIIPGIPFAPDNLMRDHRKLVFYDVNEADPERGGLFVMGIGIGEMYANPSWEDRGFRVRGPVALEARAAFRRALLRNGYGEDDIPAPLRAVATQRTQEQVANSGKVIGRALQVHNEVGFGDKKSSVARALLYNLAQPGSVIIAPDQLWLSETWAGMLAGAAARGVRVHVIAPAEANAPVPDAPAMALAHEVMSRLLVLRTQLTPQITASGGDLRVGMYAARATAKDAAGRLREVRDGLRRYPWIRELIPFDDQTLAVLDRVEREVAEDGRDATTNAPGDGRPPQPHRKTQLVARPGALAAFARQPNWEFVLADAMRVQSGQTARFADQLEYTAPPEDTAATRRSDEMMQGYEASIPEAERRRLSFYFTEGSHNMDQRGLMSDGEATLILSGPQAAGLVDLFYMMARTTWVGSQAELETHIKRPSALIRWFSHRIRATL
jgi:phosphatidylserine/phosphatidylglycerophosphate/cardiolipin synthase-like enzyme